MQLKLVIAALFGLAVNASFNKNAPEMKLLWNTWKQLHSKTYAGAEEAKRFGIFADNYLQVVSHNADKSQTFKKGLNKFSDMTGTEFKAFVSKGLKLDNKTRKVTDANVDYSVLRLPTSVDWRTQGAVTSIKDQGQCGSCWAFSATGALEGLNFITSGTLLSFSEQQLVDCETQDDGCEGGLMDHAFAYTAQEGIELESDYPYTAQDGQCQYDASLAHQVNSAFTDVQVNSAAALKAAIVQQPISVAVEADQDVFQQYTNGVITQGCGAQLDHGVLAVGYTIVGAQEAFIVKNSWGESWGDEGYLYISTNGKPNNGAGVCGILSVPSFPTA